MKKYTIDFLCTEGNFELTVNTNHTFDVESDGKFKEIAKALESKIFRNIKVYYDNKKLDLIIEIIENSYFNKVTISKFIFYDETKGEYIRKRFEDGRELYPVQNPRCLIEIDKNKFIKLMQEEYNEYFKERNVLTFEGVSYEINEIKL